MIESLAAGTPVIALRRGSVPEVIEDGVTGFICDDVDEMVEAAERIDEIDPEECRRHAERFSAEAMCQGYVEVYEALAAGDRPTPGCSSSVREGRGERGRKSGRERSHTGGGGQRGGKRQGPTRAPLPSLSREARRRHPRVGVSGGFRPAPMTADGALHDAAREPALRSVLLVGPVVVPLLGARLVVPVAAS